MVGLPLGDVHPAALPVDAVGVEDEAVGEVELLEEGTAARHREVGPVHRVGGEVVVHRDVEVVDERHLLRPRDRVFFGPHLDFQVVAERELRPRRHPAVAAPENGVVVVVVLYDIAGHRVDVLRDVAPVEHRLEGEVQRRGDDVADGVQTALLEDVHHIDFGGEVRGDGEVVYRAELAVEISLQHRGCFRRRAVPRHPEGVVLQVPSLGERDVGVPVDGLGDFDGDGERDGVHHAGLEMLPCGGLEEERVGGVQLPDELR